MVHCIISSARFHSNHDHHRPHLDTVTLERDGHVLVMGLNRPDKRNAFNLAEGVQSFVERRAARFSGS